MRRLNDQDGAVAITVAILLVVLLGIGAFVLDIGNLYWERRQLQNAADAAAMAAAQELVLGGTHDAAYSVARQYANANNSRGAYVHHSDFEVLPDRVRVTAQTGTYDDPGVLTSILAGVLNVANYSTQATAAVQMDSNVGGGKTIPIAICEDNWKHWTNGGATLPSGPPPHIISFAVPEPHWDPVNKDCGNPGASENETYAGGFAFLERIGGDGPDKCYASTTADGKAPGEPGNNLVASSTCSAQDVVNLLIDVIDNDETVLIPIFYGYEGQGSKGQFKIMGYGGFKLEGFKILSSGGGLSPDRYPSGVNWNAVGCNNPKSCLMGYYTHFVALGDAVSGGDDDYGARVLGFIE
jgi:hypothetical protein